MGASDALPQLSALRSPAEEEVVSGLTPSAVAPPALDCRSLSYSSEIGPELGW